MQRGTLSIRCLAVLAIAIGAVACSSGGSSSGGTQTGQFIDSPVQGLRYEGDSFSGVTDADGRYSFNPGDEVCFFLGLFPLGCTDASGVVTPLDLLPGFESDDDPTVNMVRLFMSLDADGDPSNGLDLSGVGEGATGNGIDFISSLTDFENDADVQAFVTMYGPAGATGDLVDAQDAEDHFQDSLEENDYFERQLIGTWLYTGWEEGDPTTSESFTIALADLETLDADVYEDGDVMFTRVQDGEDCDHDGVLNGRRGPPINLRGIDGAMPKGPENDMIFGSVGCGDDEPLEIDIQGLIQIGYATFRMDKLDSDVEFGMQDLYGYWYLMAGDDSREISFEDEEEELPLPALAGPQGVEDPPATNEMISAAGVVSFSIEQFFSDEQTQEEGFEECSYEGQMSPDKYFMSGNFTCPSGNGGVWTAEMGYIF